MEKQRTPEQQIADQIRETLMVPALPMDADEFQRALDDLKDVLLDVQVDRSAASILLFRSVSRLSRYAAGSQPVPGWLAMLLRYILLDLVMGRQRVIRGHELAERYGTRQPTVERLHKAVLEQEKHRLIAEAEVSDLRDLVEGLLDQAGLVEGLETKVQYMKGALVSALENVRSMVVKLRPDVLTETWTDLDTITNLIDRTLLKI